MLSNNITAGCNGLRVQLTHFSKKVISWSSVNPRLSFLLGLGCVDLNITDQPWRREEPQHTLFFTIRGYVVVPEELSFGRKIIIGGPNPKFGDGPYTSIAVDTLPLFLVACSHYHFIVGRGYGGYVVSAGMP